MTHQIEETPARIGTTPGQATADPLHFVTCEYPPQIGGVAAFTATLARHLALLGRDVHVWAPGNRGTQREDSGVTVHRTLGAFGRADLRRTRIELDRCDRPLTIFLQWVPHGFGFRGMNLGFAQWIRAYATEAGIRIETMVHEPFLPFAPGAFRQNAAAFVQRLMLARVLGVSRTTWVSTESWTPRMQPYLRRGSVARLLPVPTGVTVSEEATRVAEARARFLGASQCLVGHFGTFGRHMLDTLAPTLVTILASRQDVGVLLLGRGGDELRAELAQQYPALGARISALASDDEVQMSCAIQACDILVQPYPDGISTRRTSATAALAHGRPVVATTGELTESFWSSMAGIELVQAGDPNALASATLALLQDHTRRTAMGAAARELYLQRFDVSNTAHALLGADEATPATTNSPSVVTR
jgi:glycosyltransferase involved in cell wall biosynthesis